MSGTEAVGEIAPAAAGPKGVFRKILYVLSPEERRQLYLLSPAVLLMAVLDTVGIASIVPFLGLLSDPDAISRSELLSTLYTELSFSSRERFFFFIGLGVMGILSISNAFGALTTWALLRFSWMRNHTLSLRLLRSYLRRPYAYFLQKNTAELAQTILAEVQTAVSGVIVQSINVAARAVVIIGVLIALVVIDPVMAVGAGLVFGGTYGGIYFFVRTRLSGIGRRRVENNRARYKIASEVFASIKELKLSGLEERYLDRYAERSLGFSDANATARIISQLPRYALETLTFGSVLLMVLVMLRRGSDLSSVLPVLGLYAFASYRLLPKLQQVFAGLSLVRSNLASLQSVIDDLPETAPNVPRVASTNPLSFERSFSVDRVSYRYEGADRDALNGIDLEVGRGKWVAFVGPTGSGKSTLVDVLLGLLRPSAGVLQVDDEVVSDENVGAWQALAGYVPQQMFLADDTIARNVALGMTDDEIDHAWLEQVADIAQIHTFITTELPDGYQTVVGERGVRLSGGQRQRLGIARALYRRPTFLVLDEATSALDNETEARFFAHLREALVDVSVVSIAHRLTTTRDFDCIYIIDTGRVVDQGTYAELSERSAYFNLASRELPQAAKDPAC